jgi:hypothetical protein
LKTRANLSGSNIATGTKHSVPFIKDQGKMTTEAEYRDRISRYDWDDLLCLWREIEARSTPGWETGKAFEHLILRAFQLEGAEIRWPYSVKMDGDEIEQIDGVIYTDGLACLVECKDQDARVNIEPIAKLRYQLLRRPGTTIGAVFSYGGFTEPAVTLARFTIPQTILLWNGEEVSFAIQARYMRRGLVAKYRICIEHGLPDYNIRIEGLL